MRRNCGRSKRERIRNEGVKAEMNMEGHIDEEIIDWSDHMKRITENRRGGRNFRLNEIETEKQRNCKKTQKKSSNSFHIISSVLCDYLQWNNIVSVGYEKIFLFLSKIE